MARSEVPRKARKTSAPPRASKPRASTAALGGAVISPEERHRMIAEAAYYRAQQRGFRGGDPLQDWIEAEAEVASRLGVNGAVLAEVGGALGNR